MRLKTLKGLKVLLISMLLIASIPVTAQERRPIDSRHPLWLVHVDVWNKADPQKIIELVPDEIKPFVCMNLSMSCQYDKEKMVYKMPQDAVQTYKSWASVCQHNNMWFMLQPASGGMGHLLDSDLATYEYFFKRYPNFLGWNFAEQFWGFDEVDNPASAKQPERIALFAKLVEMSHNYGGLLTISFCGNIWSHLLSPNGMMKRDSNLLAACRKYPEAILWLYKYTTSSCWYNNESVTISPFISGLANNYGVRYDNCGWNGALETLISKDHGKKYPIAAGIAPVMEQTCVNGGAVWDGPELIWTEDFKNLNNTTVDGYQRRNWGYFDGFPNVWIDMWKKVLDGSLYIPTREEVVGKTKIVVVNNVTSGSDEDKYAAWGSLYDNIYKQDDPFNRGNGQWMDNFCYFKKTGRYATIPVCVELYDDLAKSIPVQVMKSKRTSTWPNETAKKKAFDEQYPEISTGDLFVSRFRNQIVTYTPYTYFNNKTTASADIPLQYNTCDKLQLTWGKISSGAIREYADHIDFYLNNFRNDTIDNVLDKIVITGAKTKPSYTATKRVNATLTHSDEWDEATGTYTINMYHNGPVDICVKCEGNAKGRATDYLPATALTADMPKMPEDYFGPVIVEAEDMDYKSVTCILDPYGQRGTVYGHSGNGFIETTVSKAGALRHTITMKKSGDYNLVIKYNAYNKAGTLDVELNGNTQKAEIKKTEKNLWQKVSLSVTLKEGENTLYLKNTDGIKMMIDYIEYVPANEPIEKFSIAINEGKHGMAKPKVETAAEGETVAFDITPDEGYAFTGWYIHPRQHPFFNEDGTMVMPNDNVTLTPLFSKVIDKSIVYSLDFTNVSEGTIPVGWQATQGGEEVHEYPNSYGSGARTFTGFVGWQERGFYWREVSAKYGMQDDYPLTLTPGKYKMTFVMAAWKGEPLYNVSIEDTAGEIYAEERGLMSAPNANGNKSADLSSAETHTLEFEITDETDYVIAFTTEGFSEHLLLECELRNLSDTGIGNVFSDDDALAEIYGMDGIKRNTLKRGYNILKMKSGDTRKVFIK